MPRQYVNQTGRVVITQENKAERFWNRVLIGAPDECWLWMGSCAGKSGYGNLGIKTWGTSKAHRMAYELHNGSAPGDLDVCHSCDNPPCCNPAHLWLGTASDNVLDAMSKGRLTPPVLPPGKAARGERVALSKITADVARAIAASSKAAGDLAEELGVSVSLIWNVRRGKTWRHATGLEPRKLGKSRHKNCRAIEIDGVIYATLTEAAKRHGMSLSGIRDRIIAGWPGHRYVPAEEFYALSA